MQQLIQDNQTSFAAKRSSRAPTKANQDSKSKNVACCWVLSLREHTHMQGQAAASPNFLFEMCTTPPGTMVAATAT